MRQLLFLTLGLLLISFGAADRALAKNTLRPNRISVESTDLAWIRAQVPQEFHNLSKASAMQNLIRQALPLKKWVTQVNQLKDLELLCLGERHDSKNRRLIAQLFALGLRADQLMLEAKPAEVQEKLLPPVLAGTSEVNLLGADIADVVRQAKKSNPGVSIHGVEQTQAEDLLEMKERMLVGDRRLLARDSFIAKHIIDAHPAGSRSVAVYGALHCAKSSRALQNSQPFFRLLSNFWKKRGKKTLSLRIVPISDFKEPLAIYMRPYVEGRGSVVISNTSQIPPAAYNYIWDVERLFRNYDAIVLLDE